MQPKLIIFDWDGTLADTTQPIIHTMQAAFQTCGFNAPADDAIRLLIGNSLHGIIAQLAPQLSATQQQQIAQAYTVSYLNPNNHNMTLFDDARACLDTLQQQGYGLAVATGKGRIGLNQAIAQTNTAHYWLTTRCASECPAKPAPDMVLEICDELGVEPADALVVGDTTYDLEMAAHARCRAVAVCTGAHSLATLQSAPHVALIQRLAELPAVLLRL